MSVKARAAAGLLLWCVTAGGGALAAPPPQAPDDRVLPPAEHRTDKARTLAARHERALQDLNREVYFCLPWLEVARQSIGFFKPRGAQDDRRYLSMRVFVEQLQSREFGSLTLQDRASSMVSRYAGPLLRRMTRNPQVLNDDAIDGFTIIVEWRNPAASREGRPVHETIAMFVEKVDADEYITNHLTMRDLVGRARILGWDGDRLVGALRLAAWDDDFVATHRVKNYELPAGVTCP